jgi:hypothetical protein
MNATIDLNSFKVCIDGYFFVPNSRAFSSSEYLAGSTLNVDAVIF